MQLAGSGDGMSPNLPPLPPRKPCMVSPASRGDLPCSFSASKLLRRKRKCGLRHGPGASRAAASQVAMHGRLRRVVPELASRDQSRVWCPRAARMAEAKATLQTVAALPTRVGRPGGALLVAQHASGSLGAGKAGHRRTSLEGHRCNRCWPIEAAFSVRRTARVGGQSQRSKSKCSLLPSAGDTRDDAAGEAFDRGEVLGLRIRAGRRWRDGGAGEGWARAPAATMRDSGASTGASA